eukprot:TRINITY_DN23537_c0_g3_i1.p1 TRINITY_DN23537_c0_g3~~TRINITY_DN23537_c0_g3_i1.p1  ORF type:complete len:644 (-),score=74.39 TRINITY_DN23537_c0_g3_i1:180-2111(-)
MCDIAQEQASKTLQELISRLICRLAECKCPEEHFMRFADTLKLAFPQLCHMSITVLPENQKAREQLKAIAPDKQRKYILNKLKGGTNAKQQPLVKSKTASKNDAEKVRNASSESQTTNKHPHNKQGISQSGNSDGFSDSHTDTKTEASLPFKQKVSYHYDWSNSCIYTLSSERGPLIQSQPEWPMTCSSSYYAVKVANDLIITQDYSSKGPHFMDWAHIKSNEGGVSMATIPITFWEYPIAVLRLGSKCEGAFDDEEGLRMLVAVLAPYVHYLDYSTCQKEMERLVNDILTPLAAELSIQQGRFKRLPNLSGDDILCLESEQNSKVKMFMATSKTIRTVDSVDSASSFSCSPIQSISKKKSQQARMLVPVEHRGAYYPKKPLNVNGSSNGKQPGIGSHATQDHDNYPSMAEQDVEWSDFCFNLVSVCLVYAYFSKNGVGNGLGQESPWGMVVCALVAFLDIAIIMLRFMYNEELILGGQIVMAILQMYRALLLPMANTWMSWNLVNRMEIAPSFTLMFLLGLTLLMLMFLGVQIRFLLNAPLQLASVLFAALISGDFCPLVGIKDPESTRCLHVIMVIQMLLGLLVPSILLQFYNNYFPRSMLPHVSIRRVSHIRELVVQQMEDQSLSDQGDSNECRQQVSQG